MQKILNKAIPAIIFSLVMSSTFGSSLAFAATNIGTNISTGGTLSVTGTSTLTGAVTAPGGVIGNASTATALLVDPTDCGIGQFATMIDASGNLTCGAFTETDPVYTANLFAVGMDQGVATTDSPTFVNVTGNLTGNASTATLAATATALAGGELDPAYTANTFAVGMDQGVATTDSPTFVNVTGNLTGNASTATLAATATALAGGELDPAYTANTFAVGMDQGVATTDSPTFVNITGNLTGNASTATLAATATALAGGELDPAYTANTFAVGMDQGVATTDSPTFVNVTGNLTGNASTATLAATATALAGGELDPAYTANTFAVGMDQGVATTDSPTFVNVTGNLTGNASTATLATTATTATNVTGGAITGETIDATVTGNGSGITNLTSGNLVGALPVIDGSALTGVVAANGVVTTGSYADPAWITSLASSKLTGALPAISGAALTSLTSGNLVGALPAISGAALTSLTSGNLVGALPAISGAALTSLTSGNLVGALPAISGAALTSLTSGNLVGALPAIDGSALTGVVAANGVVTTGSYADPAWITSLASSKLTGALPAISGAALTSLSSSALTGALPVISGAALTGVTVDMASLTGTTYAVGDGAAITNLTSGNLVGALPALDGSALTGITAAAGSLTGGTLNATVLASSLTSVGTLGSLAVTGATTTGSVAVGGGTSITKVTVGNLADDVPGNAAGWLPGGPTTFIITANAAAVTANSVISVSLGNNAAASVCSVSDRTAATSFTITCGTADVAPAAGATLQYMIVN